MRFPRSIQVGHLTYRVRAMTPLERMEQTDEQIDGLCDCEKQVILVWPMQTDGNALETLLHEVLHAINHHHGIDDKTDEETATTLQAKGWLSVFVSCPQLLEAIGKYVDGQGRHNR